MVQKGWSRARVLAELGGPKACDGATLTYVAGPYTGPELRVTFTFAKGLVVGVARSSVGCRDVQ